MPEQKIATKICIVCGEDCAQRERVKDRQGRYICQACYEKAKAKRAASPRRAKEAASPKKTDQPASGHSFDMDALTELARQESSAPALEDQTTVCSNCRASLERGAFLCMACGYNSRIHQVVNLSAVRGLSRAKMKRATQGGTSMEMPEFLSAPWIAGLAPMLVLGALFAVAMGSSSVVPLFAGVTMLFVCVVNLIVLVQAFRESVLTGLLTFFVPFYVIYFVYAVNDNAHLKWAYGAAFIALPMIFVAGGLQALQMASGGP